MVDDYDLVATPAGNPLAAILEYLPYARDLGLHLVVARRSGGAARALFEPLLAGLRDLGCLGLMMSGRPDEGALFGSARPAPLPPGRGVLIARTGDEQLVQVGWSRRRERTPRNHRGRPRRHPPIMLWHEAQWLTARCLRS